MSNTWRGLLLSPCAWGQGSTYSASIHSKGSIVLYRFRDEINLQKAKITLGSRIW